MFVFTAELGTPTKTSSDDGKWNSRETLLASLWLLPFHYILSLRDISHSHISLFDIAPWAGFIGLLYALLWGVVHRRVPLIWFVISPVLSHLMFGVALLFSRQMDSYESTWLISACWLVQLAILAFLVYRAKGMPLPAVALAVFGCSYAYHAGFFSAMALTGAWV